jgi:hypothetical protein
MDGQRFDRFTMRMVAPSSRRRAVTTYAKSALVALPATRAPNAVAPMTSGQPQQECEKTSQ